MLLSKVADSSEKDYLQLDIQPVVYLLSFRITLIVGHEFSAVSNN